MRFGGHELTLLDPALFQRKLVMLVVFFGLFVPLKIYQERLLYWYVVSLVVLHAYILFVFLYRVRWRVLAADRRAFLLRLVAMAIFIALLMAVKAGATLAELTVFVALSGTIHVALLLTLTLHVRAAATPAATDA